MLRRKIVFLFLVAIIWPGCADVNVQVPDYSGAYRSKPKVDSSKTPKPQTIEECQSQLETDYAEIRYLEKKLEDREGKIEKLERDKDKLKDEKKRLEKRLERYEDD